MRSWRLFRGEAPSIDPASCRKSSRLVGQVQCHCTVIEHRQHCRLRTLAHVTEHGVYLCTSPVDIITVESFFRRYVTQAAELAKDFTNKLIHSGAAEARSSVMKLAGDVSTWWAALDPGLPQPQESTEKSARGPQARSQPSTAVTGLVALPLYGGVVLGDPSGFFSGLGSQSWPCPDSGQRNLPASARQVSTHSQPSHVHLR